MAVLDLIPPQILPKKKKKAPKGVSIPPVNVPRYTPALIPSQNPVPRRLAGKLLDLGRRYRSVNITERLAQYLAVALCLLTLQMFLDWIVDLNLFVRLLILAADVALFVYYARRQLLPLFVRPMGLEACALMAEKHFPKLRGRLIATVQLSRPSFTRDSPELVQAIQQETDLRTASMNFASIVPTRVLKRRLRIAFLVAGIFGGWMFLTAPGSIALLERVFLLPAKVPRKTEVICLTGDKTIPSGETVVLEAEARGIIPSHGRVTLVDDAGHIQEITMDREPNNSDRFSLSVATVDHPFTYTISINDGTAGPFDIKVVPRPTVTTIDCTQVYPPYAGLPDAKRTVGNLALLAGSKLKIHAITNSKIVKAVLKEMGIDKTLPLTIGGAGANDLTGQIDIPAEKLTGFSIQLTNEAGVTSGDETQYRIDLIPDHPPTIQLTSPDRLQELDTIKAKPNIAYVATDDYGLDKVSLCYRYVHDEDDTTVDANGNPPPPPPPTRIPLDIGKDRPLNFKGTYVLDLTKLQPPVTEGTTIEYWLEAVDANNVTGPGMGETEHHVIKVVSEAEKKAEIMNRMDDDLSVIQELELHERTINHELGEKAQNRPAPAPAPPSAPTPAPAPKP
jgi:hypothetical protein